MKQYESERTGLEAYLPAEREPTWPDARKEVLDAINSVLNLAATRKGPDYISALIGEMELDHYSDYKKWSASTLRQILYSKDKPVVSNLRQRLIDLVIMLFAAFPDKNFTLFLNDAGQLLWLQDDYVFHTSPVIEQNTYSEDELYAFNARHYIAYYWRHGAEKRLEKVGCALLTVSERGWERVRMVFYYSDEVKKSIDGKLKLRQAMPPTVSNSVLYLRMEDEEDSERPTVLTQINMNVGRSDSRRLMIGTYVTTHRDPGTPTAGLMLWQRVDSWEAGDSRVREVLTDTEMLEPAIFQFLANRRVDTIRRDISDLTQLPFVRHINTLSHFVKQYQGYYINPKRDVLVLFQCSVDKLGRVHYQSNRSKHKTYQSYGLVRMLGESVRIDFDYREDCDSYRLQYNLPKAFRQLDSHQYWQGYYGGLDDRLERPVGGKVILRVLGTNEEPVVDDLSRTSFRQHQPHLAEAVLRMLDERALYDEEIKPKDIPRQAGLVDFEGVYTCYVSSWSEYHSTVLPYRLTINSDATTFLERSGVKAAGVASLQQDRYLSILLNEESGNDFTGTLLFSLDKNNTVVSSRKEIRHLYGIFSKIKALHRVEASAAVLIPERFEDREREWKEEFDREQNQEMFDQVDRELGGCLTFLSGQVYRQLRLPLKANRPFRPRKEDYRRLAFYAACYLARQIDNYPPDSEAQEEFIQHVQAHLKEAHIAGFAATDFIGYPLKNSIPSVDALRQSFAMHGFDNDKELNYLRRDLRSLRSDQQLLREAVSEDGPLSHPELINLIYRLWPELTAKLQITKPETT